MFDGKSILITGNTGSFCKHCVSNLLAKYQPKKIIIYSRDEFKPYEMAQAFSQDSLRFFIGDVRDQDRLIHTCKQVDNYSYPSALEIRHTVFIGNAALHGQK